MQLGNLARTWMVAFGSFAAVASIAYAFLPGDLGSETVGSYVLWPGTALYVLVNGSLLFGGGFGNLGNFLVIALGSAGVWSTLLVLVVRAAPSFRFKRGE